MAQYQIKKVRFKPFQYIITYNNKTYHVLQINLSSSNQLTIHSKHVWNIQYGRVDGARYKTRGKKLLYLDRFHQLENPIYYLKNKPYRILQYINESDIVDISAQHSIHGIPLFYSLQSIEEYLTKE
jgi:hypothetical protein